MAAEKRRRGRQRRVPVVAGLEQQAVHDHLVHLRDDAVRELRWARKPPPMQSSLTTVAGARELYTRRAEMQKNPIQRMHHNRYWPLRAVVLWCDYGLAALDAGEDATPALIRAFAARRRLANDAIAALCHKAIVLPRRPLQEHARAHHAAAQPVLEARDAALRREADRLRAQHPRWSTQRIAIALKKMSPLSIRRLRFIIASPG